LKEVLEMPSSEVMFEYCADQVEPIFDFWHAFGVMASLYYNSHKKEHSKASKPSDWIPRYRPAKTAKQMKNTVRAFCKALGG